MYIKCPYRTTSPHVVHLFKTNNLISWFCIATQIFILRIQVSSKAVTNEQKGIELEFLKIDDSSLDQFMRRSCQVLALFWHEPSVGLNPRHVKNVTINSLILNVHAYAFLFLYVFSFGTMYLIFL